MRARAACVLLALAASPFAMALDAPQWPPPEAEQARMRELQHAIIDPRSTPAQREAAREALSGLLKSPAGQERGRTAGEKPARAAVEPFPRIVKPLPPEPPGAQAPGVARLEVVVPPRAPAVDPRSGAVLPPSSRTAVDPTTGRVLHEVAGGYVDPTTGRFIPR